MPPKLADTIAAELPPGFVASFTNFPDHAHLKAKLADADGVVFLASAYPPCPPACLNATLRLKLSYK